jgi:peptidase YpeB-like protein
VSRWPMYRIHKWLAVTAGLFLLVWLITGVIMVLPPLSTGPAPVQPIQKIDFKDIVQSPAQAIANLEKILGTTSHVSSVGLKWIHDVLVYEIHFEDGGRHFINAVTGQVFSITRELAERFVLDAYPGQGRVQKVEMLEKHNYDYQWGPLPVYQIVLDSQQTTAYHVSTDDGSVRRSERMDRIRGAITSLHTFDPIKLITKRDAVRNGLLIITAVIGIVASLTGYYLALRRA